MKLTPLQTAAKNAIEKWTHSHPLQEVAMMELRHALASDLTQVNIYHAVNELVATIGANGSVESDHPAVDAVMNELWKIDGGAVQKRVDDLRKKGFMPKADAIELAVSEYTKNKALKKELDRAQEIKRAVRLQLAALQYLVAQTQPSHQTATAIAALKAVL